MNRTTRDSVPWRKQKSRKGLGALSDEQLQMLSDQFGFAVLSLDQLSLNVAFALDPDLDFGYSAHEEWRQERGAKAAGKAARLIGIALAKLEAAQEILQQLRFEQPLGVQESMEELQAGRRMIKQLASGVDALEDYLAFLKASMSHDLVLFAGPLDGRRIRDIRRQIVCEQCFSFWWSCNRRLSFTTDPITSERSGPLIEFVNAVVQCLTDPPFPLKPDTIVKELERDKSKGGMYYPGWQTCPRDILVLAFPWYRRSDPTDMSFEPGENGSTSLEDSTGIPEIGTEVIETTAEPQVPLQVLPKVHELPGTGAEQSNQSVGVSMSSASPI